MLADSEKARKGLLRKYGFDDYGRTPVSFYYCQGGYMPLASKPAIIWTREIFRSGKARLLSKAGGKVKELRLSGGRVNIWGRQEWLIDISHGGEGDYKISARFGDYEAESPVFSIRGDLYSCLVEKAAKHFYLKRCGVVCHPHDAYEYSFDMGDFGERKRHVRADGGWHDAHDDNKWAILAWGPLYGLLRTHEAFSPPLNAPGKTCFLDEARWEVEWLLKMQKKNGSFYYAVLENDMAVEGGKPRIFPWNNHIYDDCCDDRRMLLDSWGRGKVSGLIRHKTVRMPSTEPKFAAYLAHNLMHFARLARAEAGFRKVSRRAGEAADLAAGYVKSLDRLPAYQELEVNAGLALYHLERYRLTGGNPDLAEAEARIGRMAAMQQAEGHFHSSRECRGLEFYPDEAGDDMPCYLYPFGYVAAFTEYLGGARNGEFHGRIKNEASRALENFASLLERLCRTTGFMQMAEPRVERRPSPLIHLSYTGHGYNVFILSAGIVLASAGRLCGKPEWRKLAERQLYWVLGFNPRFMSFMNDVGVRNSGTYSYGGFVNGQFVHRGFYRHRRDMRWGITTGIYEGKVKGYPECGLSYSGEYDPRAQETWLNATGFFLRLLAELSAGD